MRGIVRILRTETWAQFKRIICFELEVVKGMGRDRSALR